MFQMMYGCQIPFPERMQEGYEILGNLIVSNVSAEKIEAVMRHFICMHEEPIFFILELPLGLDEEKKMQGENVTAFHNAVYYIDGCTQEEALTILDEIGPLAINDGFCEFGFGGHKSQDEIMSKRYNEINIFSKDIDGFRDFMAEHQIEKVDHLVTAWNTFTKEHPGQCDLIELDGKNIYSFLDDFSEWGIYKAEIRERC